MDDDRRLLRAGAFALLGLVLTLPAVALLNLAYGLVPGVPPLAGWETLVVAAILTGLGAYRGWTGRFPS